MTTNSLFGVSQRHVRLLLIAALVVQLALIVYINRPWIPIDTRTYLDLARSVAHLSFSLPTASVPEPTPYRAPGFPVFLAAILDIAKLPNVSVILIYAILYIICIFYISKTYFERQAARNIYIALCLIYPFTAFYLMNIATEGLAIGFLVLMTIILSQKSGSTLRDIALVGILGGIVSLIRPDTLPVLALPVIVVAWRRYRSGHLRQAPIISLANMALAPAIALLIMSPFAIWNYHHFNKISVLPAASAMGKSLYIATWDGILDIKDLGILAGTADEPQQPTTRAIRAGLARDVADIERMARTTAADDPIYRRYPYAAHQIALDDQFKKHALDRIRADPGQYVGHLLRSVWNIWNTQEYPPSLPSFARIALMAMSGLTITLAALGAIMSLIPRSDVKLSRVPLLTILIVTAVHLPLHTEARYTATVRLLMLIYAASFVIFVVHNFTSKYRRDRADMLPEASRT